ncbi:hypothetical protein JZ751_016205 [Albula glossodonta]|uniref:Uncharacterized protein n=1 Tax=Albula glossodonta TaxID=121402 RepID=A0A8T2MM40_9TELE|nr:hypothetical protein JZ751_016205 [Albula glossodonta]
MTFHGRGKEVTKRRQRRLAGQNLPGTALVELRNPRTGTGAEEGTTASWRWFSAMQEAICPPVLISSCSSDPFMRAVPSQTETGNHHTTPPVESVEPATASCPPTPPSAVQQAGSETATPHPYFCTMLAEPHTPLLQLQQKSQPPNPTPSERRHPTLPHSTRRRRPPPPLKQH